jgi:hypothetical protein
MSKSPTTARAICKEAGLSLSQWQKAKKAGVDVKDIEAMKAFRKTLNVRAPNVKKADLSTPPPESGSMSLGEIEEQLRRPDLDPNTARTLKLRIESLRGMVKYQAEMGKLVSRAEVEEHFVRAAMGIQSFLRRYEREVPALCLGLPLSQSVPIVKAKTRELQDMLANLQGEFWKEHPDSE